jgi:hypothetical protein
MIDMTMMQKFIDLGDLARVQRDPPVPSRHCDAELLLGVNVNGSQECEESY